MTTHFNNDVRFPLTHDCPAATPDAPEAGDANVPGGLPFGFYSAQRLFDICWGKRGAGVGSLQHVQAGDALKAGRENQPSTYRTFVGATFIPDGTFALHFEPMMD